jgi:predicted O-methyltransferase YrrM
VCGLLIAHQEDDARRYELPAGAAEALTDETSLAYLGPLPRMFAAAARHLPELLDAYRNGEGVSWEELGADARESQAALNRPWFERRLGAALRGVSELDEVLGRPGARILDIGCGGGWSTIALARACPSATVEGVDIDAPSVEMARRNAAASDVADRVSFRVADAGSLAGAEKYDAAFAFECVHDMPRPVDVLAATRGAVRDDGVVVVMDEAVADEFTAPGDELERFMYAASIFVCLPDGLSSAPSRGTGTVMRHATLRGYAQEAGFEDVEVLPIEDFSFFRFYRLR